MASWPYQDTNYNLELNPKITKNGMNDKMDVILSYSIKIFH